MPATVMSGASLALCLIWSAMGVVATPCNELVSTTDSAIVVVHNVDGAGPLSIHLPQCINSTRSIAPFGGVARQQCIADSLAAVIARGNGGEGRTTATAQSVEPGVAVCVASALVSAGVLDDCHEVAHVVGHELWRSAIDGVSPVTHQAMVAAAAMADVLCPSGCISGCAHAVLSRMVSVAVQLHGGNETALRALFREVCTGAFGGCRSHLFNHGIGHGLAAAAAGPDGAAIGGVEGALALCGAAPIPTKCVGAVMMEYVDSALERIFDTADPDTAAVAAVCAPFDRPGSSLLQKCGDAVGEGLMFSTCHDVMPAVQVCRNSTRSVYSRACIGGAAGEAKTVGTVQDEAAATAGNFATCVRAAAPTATANGLPVATVMADFWAVSRCGGPADAACCGDGECAWGEGPANCAADCPAEAGGGAVPAGDPRAALEQALSESPDVTLATNGGACTVKADKLPFCGKHVPFPIPSSEAASVALDRQIQGHFEVVAAAVDAAQGSVASVSECLDVLARHYCLTAFEMCEGSDSLEFCWHAHPRSYRPADCGAAFVCPANTTASAGGQQVVCGPSPWYSVLCVDGASACGGLVASAASTDCALQVSSACAAYAKEDERCYDHATHPTARRPVDVFYATGDGKAAVALWAPGRGTVTSNTNSTTASTVLLTSGTDAMSTAAAPGGAESTLSHYGLERGCCVSFAYDVHGSRCCHDLRDNVQESACVLPSSLSTGGMDFFGGTACADVVIPTAATAQLTVGRTSPAAADGGTTDPIPAAELARDQGRCVPMTLELTVCAPHVTYPVAMSVASARAIDAEIKQHALALRRWAVGHAKHLAGAPAGCASALVREMCLHRFPMCEGPLDVPYCWGGDTDGRGAPAGCRGDDDAPFVCPGSADGSVAPLVCGPGAGCVREGGGAQLGSAGACAGLPVPAASFSPSDCAAGRRAACQRFGVASGRCFERSSEWAPGAPAATVASFTVVGGDADPVLLWQSAETTAFAEDGGAQPKPPRRHGAAATSRQAMVLPAAAVVATVLVLVVAALKLRRWGAGNRGAAYTAVADGFLDDSSEEEAEYDGDAVFSGGAAGRYSPDDTDRSAARSAVAARMKLAAADAGGDGDAASSGSQDDWVHL
mmetsp:Transcript_14282/g.42289  ORF Transcript_14282/g.42289 Transcript_14282/m.42289 type:complete len:1125 (+) Transcript_14282:138-3512(+)